MAVDSLGDLACGMVAGYGLEQDPWQRVLLWDWLETAEDGRWAASTDAVSVARQNGKNGACEAFEVFLMLDGYRILHTAHEAKTAMKHFQRLKHFFGTKVDDPRANFPELNRLVTKVRSVNGQEAIELDNGAAIEVSARTGGAGRGFTADVLVCDEAQHMTDEQQEALKPTISAGPKRNPKTLLLGTPPSPRATGEVFARLRREALRGDSQRVGWTEFSPEDGADIGDPEVWRACNPGLITGRLMWDQVEDERASMSDDGFARERLGRWDSDSASAEVISSTLWESALDAASVPVDRFAVAVDVSPDLTVATVAAAGRRADGGWHVEVLATRSGADWVPGVLAKLVSDNPKIRAVVIDIGTGSGKVIADDVVQARVKPTYPKSADVGVACERFVQGVRAGEVRHIGQVQLGVALAAARRRRLGQTDLWAWNRKDAASDITPVVACTLALWGAQNSEVTRPRRGGSNGSRRVGVVL